MNRIKLSDLVVVTTNENKLAEINEILGTDHQVSKIDICEIQSFNLDEIITHKAREAYKKIQVQKIAGNINNKF